MLDDLEPPHLSSDQCGKSAQKSEETIKARMVEGDLISDILRPLETVDVLGSRSDNSLDALGARSFQPHITLLRPGVTGSGLAELGRLFREAVSPIRLSTHCRIPSLRLDGARRLDVGNRHANLEFVELYLD